MPSKGYFIICFSHPIITFVMEYKQKNRGLFKCMSYSRFADISYTNTKGKGDKDMSMSIFSGGIWIVAGLVAVLFLGMVKNKAEMILNFLMRGMAGMLMLYFANHYLEGYLPQLKPGYNWLTFALCGLLGLPGVLLIYGILFFLQMLS